MSALAEIIKMHKENGKGGIYSICSANPYVIEASILHAKLNAIQQVLIEATCNQVNQFGGYSGMQPLDFVAFVNGIAAKIGYDSNKIIFGGDHLGPNPWQDKHADEAMEIAREMIIAFVKAGFTKIHIDCSMACAGDTLPLSDEIIAARAAYLAQAAEQAATEVGTSDEIRYIIGSEVPVPGGATENIDTLRPTEIAAVTKTLAVHKSIFAAQNLVNAFSKVIAIVVQPGVEFDNHQVFDFAREKAKLLSNHIEKYDGLVYEAHSTDYQTANALKSLVSGHFAILKVGPALTFAMREAIWALDLINNELRPKAALNLRGFIVNYLKSHPKYWNKYYEDSADIEFELQYGLSDRIRYYWPDEEVNSQLLQLLEELEKSPPPFALVSQFLPASLRILREFELEITPLNLILGQVMAVLNDYYFACER